MRKPIVGMLGTAALAVVITLSGLSPAQQQKGGGYFRVTIAGTVTNRRGEPISAVDVAIYSDGMRIGHGGTNRQGEYSIPIDAVKTISSIHYEHTKWQPAAVELLSGSSAQSIHKVMYEIDDKLSKREAAEQLTAYNILFYDEYLGPKPNLKKLAEKYRGNIENLKIKDAIEGDQVAAFQQHVLDTYARAARANE